MSLVLQHHNPHDLWSDDPFNHAEVLNEKALHDLNHLLEGNYMEDEWPVVPAQRQIIESGELPWCHISLILPRQSAPDAARIQSSWKQLCSIRKPTLT